MSTNTCSCGRPYLTSTEEVEFIDFDDVQQIIPMSKSRLYALMREAKFPRPVKLVGEHRAAWIKHEVVAYRDARIAERDSLYKQ